MSILSLVFRLSCKNKFNKTFQGHGVFRHEEVLSSQCHCHDVKQRRMFINFPTPDRKKYYLGRQLIGFSMQQMFEVVSDVGNYKKFLPWCTQSTILENNPNHILAELVIGFPPIKERYTSKVIISKPHLVRAESLDSRVFKHMITVWRFSPGLKQEPNSCVIDFQLSFEFKSIFHSQLSTLVFDQISKQMENAFIDEAARRNGPASIPARNLLIDGKTINS